VRLSHFIKEPAAAANKLNRRRT